MARLEGQTLLDRYVIQKFIGRGGMAEVYRVWDRQRSVNLAMKLLHEDLAIDKVFIRRFKREAQTLARLQHPNIVRFYGIEQSGPNAFMLLEYIDGLSLKRLIFNQDGPVSMKEVTVVLRALCGALGRTSATGVGDQR